MSKFKRWYYELTEKQVNKITLIVAIIFIIHDIVNFFVTYTHGTLPKDDELIFYIFSLFCIPLLAAFFVYFLLWGNLNKQFYIRQKKYNELCINVKNRFNLSPEFKEVIFTPSYNIYNPSNFVKMIQNSELTFFAKEENEEILLSIQKNTDKQPTFFPIDDYNFFDKNFSPKE